ncbi:DNA-binding transcriptional LysR family regulator [Agrobacterium vitis]|nr:DNA-binding transcriptional LysR family regulator [Agrobacterium vitis]MBE1437867.1 DNA-binding transcriptional LysR family regulator [Agrobacterium vitis]
MSKSDHRQASCPYNLRHLRIFLSVVDTGSVTKAAQAYHVSQPAVTQALSKMEQQSGVALLTRTPQGLFASKAGEVLCCRVRRAFALLDPAFAEISSRLHRTASVAQLVALIAVREAENFTLAARQIGLAQATVHRAISQLEHEVGRPLFERSPHGIVATRQAQALAQAARLAFAELAQADAELADLTARDGGHIVVGAMPLSRSYALPRTIAAFRTVRPSVPVHIVEGPYNDLLAGLRRGEIDFLIGALRNPTPIADVEQQALFDDTLVLLCGARHPLAAGKDISVRDLLDYPWITPPAGTPARRHFDELFSQSGNAPPKSIVESSSFILMRELLDNSDHLGCTSALQAEADIARGLLKALPLDMRHTARPIGLTLRKDWLPTQAQKQFLDLLLAQTTDHLR